MGKILRCPVLQDGEALNAVQFHAVRHLAP
jgi:hypothetical protein